MCKISNLIFKLIFQIHSLIMKVLEICSKNEIDIWNERCKKLYNHNCKNIRKMYFPHNMDEWKSEENRIIKEYNLKISEMNKEM